VQIPAVASDRDIVLADLVVRARGFVDDRGQRVQLG
jgi:hypothetical protein